MGVYIKGMEMPTNCGDCKAFVCYRQWAGDVGDCFCGITKNDAKAKEKNADCPLVPVPPHGRLGDLDALSKALRDEALQHTIIGDLNRMALGAGEVIDRINSAPTIIPADPEKEVTNV